MICSPVHLAPKFVEMEIEIGGKIIHIPLTPDTNECFFFF